MKTKTTFKSFAAIFAVFCIATTPVFAQGNNWKLTGNNNVDPSDFIGTTNNEDLRIKTNGQSRMTITKDGNVCIGALTTGEKFEVIGSARITEQLKIGTNTMILGPLFTGGPANNIFTDNADLLINSTPTLNFNTVINASNTGNVGIGTTTPQTKLDVVGSATIGTRSGTVGSNSFAQGLNNRAEGDNSHAEGNNNRAFGDNSHAEGSGNTATGKNSHAEGQGNGAGADNSHVEGSGNDAEGFNAHAEGKDNQAFGDNSHAEGLNNLAIGDNSHVEGTFSEAEGDNSHAQGMFTQASGVASHSGGIGAVPGLQFLKATGRATFNHSEINLSYTGTGAAADNSAILGGLNHEVQAGANNSVTIGGDGNSIQAAAINSIILGGSGISATDPNKVYMPNAEIIGNVRIQQVGSGAFFADLAITSNGTLTTSSSDKRLKTNITPLKGTLDKVLQIQGVSYNWKDADASKKDIGFIAQEVETIFPEVVFINAVDGYKGINYSRFPAILVEAIKEQQQIIMDQEEEIESQRGENKKRAIELKIMKEEQENTKAEIEELKSALEAYGLDVQMTKTKLEGEKQTIILNQNDPNPFKEKTTIKYFIPNNVENAQIMIYDGRGRLIKEVAINQGFGNLEVFASNLSTGVYTYSIIAQGEVIDTKRMILAE